MKPIACVLVGAVMGGTPALMGGWLFGTASACLICGLASLPMLGVSMLATKGLIALLERM